MPCDQVIRNQVEFKAGTDPALLQTALEACGFNVYGQAHLSFYHRDNYSLRGTFQNGMFDVAEGVNTDAIKQQYSVASVKATAKKFGWTVKQDQKNPLKMQVTRRS